MESCREAMQKRGNIAGLRLPSGESSASKDGPWLTSWRADLWQVLLTDSGGARCPNCFHKQCGCCGPPVFLLEVWNFGIS